MNEFLQNLRVNPEETTVLNKPENVFRREMDAYRELVATSLPGFISFMEALNSGLNSLEDDLIMSNIEFKARLKDAIGALENSQKKPLDDLFGFEIITPNEIDKEILMVLLNQMFDDKLCSRIKSHNKSNGYKAFHRTGVIKEKVTVTDYDEMIDYILNTKVKKLRNEHRDKTRDEQKGIPHEECFEEDYLYPGLRKLIQEGNLSRITIDSLINARNTIYSDLNKINYKDIPVIEIQFKTAEVAEEANFGTASHTYYKRVDEEKIKEEYKSQKFIRGIHYPFKFYRKNGKMLLQPSNYTLFEMYPFLKETIVKFRQEHPTPNPNYNMHFAIIFPELKPYIKKLSKKEPYRLTKNTNKKSIWEIIKSKIINPEYFIPEYSKTHNKEGEQK